MQILLYSREIVAAKKGRRKETKAKKIIASVLCGLMLTVPAYALPSGNGNLPEKLIPLGKPIGIKLYSDGVIVSGITEVKTPEGEVSPAAKAGIKPGDIIIAADGNAIKSTEDLQQILAENTGDAITFEIIRDHNDYNLIIQPVKSFDDNLFKIGAWVRDSMAGIGTVSFVDPETSIFGALGHAVCDIDSGKIIPVREGSVMPAAITDVKKGVSGEPGELHGSFDLKHDVGQLEMNTENGIFGVMTDNSFWEGAESYPVADKSEIQEGKAFITSTVDGNTPEKYEIEIMKVYNDKTHPEKNMVIKITDERLLEKTGGIVQGMSGSPIIQNGKIIGAVTHVLINDPQKGYAVFVENMLNTVFFDEKMQNAA